MLRHQDGEQYDRLMKIYEVNLYLPVKDSKSNKKKSNLVSQ